MREKARERIGHLYPQVDLPKEYGGGKATVIAWIWARTVASPDPAFSGHHVPLANSFVLSSKKGAEAVIIPAVDRVSRSITFSIKSSNVTSADLEAAATGTKAGKAQDFICVLSGTPIQREYIRQEGKDGRLGVTLMAVVAEVGRRRIFLPPRPEWEELAREATKYSEVAKARETYLSGPTPTRAMITGGVCSAYGLDIWGKLFTDRQLLALSTLSELVHQVRQRIAADAAIAGMPNSNGKLAEGARDANAYAEAVGVYLGLGISRLADIQNSLCRWESSKTQVRNLFGRQAIPMMWDFGENNLFSDAAGDYRTSLGSIVKVIERFAPASNGAQVSHDAQTVTYPENTVISTDPPYYDNIGYADLSDFFYCWLKPALRPIWPDLFGTLVTPKADELVATLIPTQN